MKRTLILLAFLYVIHFPITVFDYDILLFSPVQQIYAQPFPTLSPIPGNPTLNCNAGQCGKPIGALTDKNCFNPGESFCYTEVDSGDDTGFEHIGGILPHVLTCSSAGNGSWNFTDSCFSKDTNAYLQCKVQTTGGVSSAKCDRPTATQCNLTEVPGNRVVPPQAVGMPVGSHVLNVGDSKCLLGNRFVGSCTTGGSSGEFQDCQAQAGGSCQQNGNKATCITPTPTTAPTATPIPDPDGKCTHPDRPGILFNDRRIVCEGTRAAGGYEVVQCTKTGENTWEFVPIGQCTVTVTTALNFCPYIDKDNHPEYGDSCNGKLEPYPTPDPKCMLDTDTGQFLPQVGVTCGIPLGEPVPVIDATGVDSFGDEDNPNNEYHACCFSTLAHWKTPPLSCVASLPGSWDDDFIDWIGNTTDTVVRRLPFFFLPESENIGVGTLQKLLKDTPECAAGSIPNGIQPGEPGCVCQKGEVGALDDYCSNIKDPDEQAKCQGCVAVKTKEVQVTVAVGETYTKTVAESQGVWTALGCIDVQSKNGFIQTLFRLGISLGGAFALLCNIYGAFLFQTSQGSPERIKQGRDLITSCITGLILLVFSVFILRLIGYNILQIPGFG